MDKTTKIPDCLFNHFKIPVPIGEYKFLPDRKFRLDFFWPDASLAVEINGGIWIQGRHTRGAGFARDMEKSNLMAEHGIALLQYTPAEINFEQIKKVYETRKGKHIWN